MKKKIAVAITGASGSIYAQRLLDILIHQENIEIGLVLSKNAKEVWNLEIGEVFKAPDSIKVYEFHDYFAPFASGSSKYEALVIVPCSMGTAARIAHGLSDDLITRTADVMLKEKRKLICVIRDTPLNLIHLKNLVSIAEAGGIVLPAAPSFYSKPQNIEALVDTVVHRIIDHLNIEISTFRWGEN
ncbi:MAG: aromatic acid decarboxylase [Bacteroidia bacterium]|nr:MAG: aromatic acid decarboxylase [Bacteroidia bacterium]